jgi:hypothetical protein
VDVRRNGNSVLVTEPLGFNFDDGRLVLTLRQAKELQEALHADRSWLFDEIEGEQEDG